MTARGYNDLIARADLVIENGEVVKCRETDIPGIIRKPALPAEAAARKNVPIGTGVLDYFPRALAEVARVSKAGNDQHNPGQPLHWSKHKSSDHGDCIIRHFIERGTLDTADNPPQRHSAKLAWRALALLEMELEADAAGMSVPQYIDHLKAKAAAQ